MISRVIIFYIYSILAFCRGRLIAKICQNCFKYIFFLQFSSSIYTIAKCRIVLRAVCNIQLLNRFAFQAGEKKNIPANKKNYCGSHVSLFFRVWESVFAKTKSWEKLQHCKIGNKKIEMYSCVYVFSWITVAIVKWCD